MLKYNMIGVKYPLQTKAYSSVRFRTHSFQFHYIFCWFSYYLLLLPYRFEIVQNECRIRRHRLQKILCILLNTSILIMGTLELRKLSVGPTVDENPEKFFRIIMGISMWHYILVYIRLCFKGSNFKEIMTAYSWCNDYPCNKGSKDKYAAIIICLYGIIACFGHFISEIFWGKDFKNILRLAAGKFYFRLFLRDSNSSLLEEELTSFSIVLALAYIFCDCCLRISNYYVEIYFYLSSMSVYRLLKDFFILLRAHPNLCVTKISQCYDDMKNILNNINSVAGGIVVVMLVTAIPYHSGNLCVRFDSDSFWFKMDYLQYVLMFAAALVIAAEANSKMQDFFDYLIKLKKNEDPAFHAEKLSLLLLEISTTTFKIGLKGYGFFTITYPFLGTVFSVVVTYVIIIMQLRIVPETPS